jgi:hypothetical protein
MSNVTLAARYTRSTEIEATLNKTIASIEITREHKDEVSNSN